METKITYGLIGLLTGTLLGIGLVTHPAGVATLGVAGAALAIVLGFSYWITKD